MYRLTLICLFLSSVTFPLSVGRSHGASSSPEVCLSMMPRHNNTPPQSSPVPFDVNSSNLLVSRGQILRVRIQSLDQPFAGFVIQARALNAWNKIVGQFLPSDDNGVRLMDCIGAVGNSVTHTSPKPKNTISLQWQAPSDFTGRIVFK